MTFNKDIAPSYETIGRRRRIAGYIGQITDESGVVLHSQEYDNHHAAEVALDALVRELLIDYCDQGLVDELPAFDGPAAAPGGILVVLVDTLPACDPPAEPSPLGSDEGDTVPSSSLLTDVHTVLQRCLSNDALVGIVPELRRVMRRVEQALIVEPV